ncbi:MAG: pilus assembly protein [Methylococcales bacterium]
MSHSLTNPPINQQGVALVVSLVILLLTTVIGVTAMQGTTMESRMATNMLDRERAFEAAEAALRDAESWIMAQNVNPGATSNGASGIWTDGTPFSLGDGDDTNDLNSIEVDWANDGTEYGATDIQGVNTQPRYIIEEHAFIPDDESTETLAKGRGFFYYRVTARGTGGSDAAQVILQTMLRKRFL